MNLSDLDPEVFIYFGYIIFFDLPVETIDLASLQINYGIAGLILFILLFIRSRLK